MTSRSRVVVECERVRGKARPRFGRYGTYRTAEDAAWEKLISDAYRSQGGELHDGEVSVDIKVSRHLPKSKAEDEPDIHKPDIDNIAKSVLDALNGIAWKDDRYVTRLRADKAWRTEGDRDYVQITVEDVGEGERPWLESLKRLGRSTR